MYAAELLSDRSGSVGYLLKDRVGQVKDFVDAVRQVADGGTVMDPEVIALPPSDDDHRRVLAVLTYLNEGA